MPSQRSTIYRKWMVRGGFAAAVLVLTVLPVLWFFFIRAPEYRPFANPEEHFKYGSIHSGNGMPLYIWEVLPEVFLDKLPGGLPSLGLILEEGRSTPVGFGVRTVGYPGIAPNCALCHTATYRTSAAAIRSIAPAGPAHQLDFDRLQQFIYTCVSDARFTGKTLLPAIEKRHQLGWVERAVYKNLLVPATRRAFTREKNASTWMASRAPAGCGRTDAFNRLKINVLRMPDDGSIGNSDITPLWRQNLRAGQRLHWNGIGRVLAEENLISAMAIVEKPANFDAASFAIITNYLWNVVPPPYPFPVDQTLARDGAALFESHCARCHLAGGEQFGKIIGADHVMTDPALTNVFTTATATRLKSINRPPFTFAAVDVTAGYVNLPIDGCWLRAPYLHNGSVPTLWDLLQPAAQRPKKFLRGYDVFDSELVGFIHDGIEAQRVGFEYDTSLPGNSNAGHEYGINLGDGEKRALLEYLKTL